MKLCKLYDIPEEALIIFGDDQGRIGIATYEFVQDCALVIISEDLKVIQVGVGFHSYEIPIPIDPWTPPDMTKAFDEETIELHRYVISNRWIVKAGYGPITRTWVVDERGPEKIPSTTTLASLQEALLQTEWLVD